MIERDPRDPPLLHHADEFDNIIGVLFSSIEVHYPTKLKTTKEVLRKVVMYTYICLINQVRELNPNNENKAARLTIRALRDRLHRANEKIRLLEASI